MITLQEKNEIKEITVTDRKLLVSRAGHVYYENGKQIPEHLAANKYLTVGVYSKVLKKMKLYRVQTLIAFGFLEQPEDKAKNQVDHINMDKTDNRAENLRYVTKKENIKFALNTLGTFNIRKPVSIFTTSGELVRNCAGLKDASRFLNRDRAAVKCVLDRPGHYCAGYEIRTTK